MDRFLGFTKSQYSKRQYLRIEYSAQASSSYLLQKPSNVSIDEVLLWTTPISARHDRVFVLIATVSSDG